MLICLYIWTISFTGCNGTTPARWDVLAENRNKAVHTALFMVADFDKNSGCDEVVGIQRGEKICFLKAE